MSIENGFGQEKDPLEVLLHKALEESSEHISIPEEFKNAPEIYISEYQKYIEAYFSSLLETAKSYLDVYIETTQTYKNSFTEVGQEMNDQYKGHPHEEEMKERIQNKVNDKHARYTQMLSERIFIIKGKTADNLRRMNVNEKTAQQIVDLLIRQYIEPI